MNPAALHAEVEERLDLYAVAGGGFVPGIHYGLLPYCVGDETVKGAYVVRHVVVERGSRLDFAKGEQPFSLRDKIDFHAVACPHEVEVVRFAAVEAVLDSLHDYHVLKEVANKRVGGYLAGGLDAEEVACEPCFGEVYFGCLYEALAEVLVVRPQGSRYVGRFENGQPFLRGGRRNACVARKRIDVEQLRNASGKDPHERLERTEISEVGYLANVSFYIRSEVVGVEADWFGTVVVEARHEAVENPPVPRLFDSGIHKFLHGEGEQFKNASTACERLRHSGLKGWLVAAGQHVHGVPSRFVDLRLYVADDFRRVLYFIEYHRRLVSFHEGAGISDGFIAYVGDFKVYIFCSGKDMLCKCGFPGLTRPNYRDNRVLRPEFSRRLRHCSFYHHKIASKISCGAYYSTFVGAKAILKSGFAQHCQKEAA